MASVSSTSSSGSDDENNDKQAASTSGSSNPFASMIDTDFDMSKVPETEDIRVEQYFSKEELAELSKIEMTRYRNMKRNYDVMRMLGLPGKKPYFMERNRRSLVQPKEPPTPPLTSSESEEDEEWTPELERKKNQPPKKQLLTTTLQPAKQQELKKEPVEDRGETRKSRYPQRNIPRKNYKEVELPDDDHYLFVKDKEVPKGEPNRAVRTLPDYLSVCPSKIKGAGDGVWLDGKTMQKNLVFGPYDGKISGPEIGMTSGYAWQISKNDKVKYYIDATDVTKSSWMRYVNCARNEEEQNLVAFQYYRNIYYRTYKPVPPGTELLVWYGNEYAKELGISEKPQTKGEESNKQKQSKAYLISDFGMNFKTVSGDQPPH
ncbi:PRDM9 [Branchiostoma lanceolatum]|uniref:PRDM9 protein n=1 Tax=Branchiostoma lanceolatum TaxID=7740 RepID=A0A8J9ZJP2_BRALA|nr:PRDM9 [Branchiostoma lanceolatum]